MRMRIMTVYTSHAFRRAEKSRIERLFGAPKFTRARKRSMQWKRVYTAARKRLFGARFGAPKRAHGKRALPQTSWLFSNVGVVLWTNKHDAVQTGKAAPRLLLRHARHNLSARKLELAFHGCSSMLWITCTELELWRRSIGLCQPLGVPSSFSYKARGRVSPLSLYKVSFRLDPINKLQTLHYHVHIITWC